MRKKKESHQDTGRWMLTYSDLITLLMIFFVVMYSMSNIDSTKYKQLSESLKVSMGGGKSIVGNEDSVDINKQDTSKVDTKIAEENKLEEVKKQLDMYLQKNNMKGNVSTNIDERGLVVSISDTLFFDTGKAEIKSESKKKIVEIGKIINQLGNYIRIEGHTDNVPISNNEFSSNWQLSAIRATNVVELLIKESSIPPQKLTSVGCGEYRPVADNSTDVGKAKNRRVDIIIINSKYNGMETNKK